MRHEDGGSSMERHSFFLNEIEAYIFLKDYGRWLTMRGYMDRSAR